MSPKMQCESVRCAGTVEWRKPAIINIRKNRYRPDDLRATKGYLGLAS